MAASGDDPGDPLMPQQIRALRGGLSRAKFAERLGVTAQTVYRWELPPSAPQFRRPRGAALVRCDAWLRVGARPRPRPVAPKNQTT